MKRSLYDYDLSRSEWEDLIDQYVFSERDRAVLKRRLLDGITFEDLSAEFDLSEKKKKNIVYRLEEILFKRII